MSQARYFIKDNGINQADLHAKWDDGELTDRLYKFSYNNNDDITKIEMLDSTDSAIKLIGDGYEEIYQGAFDDFVDAICEYRIGGRPTRPS